MTLVDLIKGLKEELKRPGGGDRELRPDVTVVAILAPTPTNEAIGAHIAAIPGFDEIKPGDNFQIVTGPEEPENAPKRRGNK